MNILFNEIKQLVEEGLSINEICNKLQIKDKRVVKSIILDENDLILHDKLRNNTRIYTNKNLVHQGNVKKDYTTFPINEITKDILINKLGFVKLSEKYQNIKPCDLSSYIHNYLKLHDKLKENNQLYKSAKSKQDGIDRRNKRLEEYYETYHEIIYDLIVNQNEIVAEIQRQLQIRKFYIQLIIKKLNLEQQAKINSYNFIKAQCQVNSAKNKITNTGRRYLKIQVNDEMIEFYKQLHIDKIKDGPGKELFHKKFKTSSGVWPVLQKQYGELVKNPARFLCGKDNLMYGKEPDYKAGRGIQGHLLINGKQIFFRSSLELRIYLYLMKHNILFSLSNHVVFYEFEGKPHHYHQDIVIDDVIYEIKPLSLIELEINKRKFAALENYCKIHNLKCDHITEKTYNLEEIDFDYMLDAIDNGILIMKEKQLNRLFKLKL